MYCNPQTLNWHTARSEPRVQKTKTISPIWRPREHILAVELIHCLYSTESFGTHSFKKYFPMYILRAQ